MREDIPIGLGFPGGSEVKNPPLNAGGMGSIPGSVRSPGGANGNPLTPVLLPGKSHGQRSLEGLMLKLKLQHFGHLMRRVDSLGKTLMRGKTAGRRRRGDKG